MRPFLIGLCELTALDAAPAGKLVLAAVRSLPGLAIRKVSVKLLDAAEVWTGRADDVAAGGVPQPGVTGRGGGP